MSPLNKKKKHIFIGENGEKGAFGWFPGHRRCFRTPSLFRRRVHAAHKLINTSGLVTYDREYQTSGAQDAT